MASGWASTTDRGSSTRQGRAALSDLRLWLGVVLLIAAVLAGGVLVGRSDGGTTVWRATHDLGAGAELSGLVRTTVPDHLAGGTYLASTQVPEGRLRWPVPAGALIPAAALDDQAFGGTRRITVPVDPLHAPVGLSPGQPVDVWWTAADTSAAPAGPPTLVLRSVVVADVSEGGVGLGGELAVVLDVDESDVADVVRAAASGHLDLVAVRLGARGSAA